MRFLNRSEELKLLSHLIDSEPNSITIWVGPKSCGKSTLLKEALNRKKEEVGENRFKRSYLIYWFDMREILVSTYEDFLDILFEPQRTKSKKQQSIYKVEGGIHFSFKVSPEILTEIKNRAINPFRYLADRIRYNFKHGRKVIVVFDEVQVLRNLYYSTNRELRNLLEELFNFFVVLTKVDHISHVWITSSDAIFIEDINRNSQLDRCMRYYFINHLEKEESLKLLAELGFNMNESLQVWETIGGDLWAWNEMICEIERGRPLSTVLSELERASVGRLRQILFALSNENQKLHESVDKLLKAFIFSNKVPIGMPYTDWEAVKWLVVNDVLFYNPIDAVLLPQSPLTLNAIRNLITP